MLPANPSPSHRPVAIWLLVCCAMIFAMVVIGGVTRLTESGLSITEWKPVEGTIPPLTQQAWQEAFEKYRQIPEYRLRNEGMTLAEFKNIFWWEYVHRLWGRLIGIAFLVPLVWFVARGHVRGRLTWQLGGIFVLGGLQGALGWYMVQSGLADQVDVSPYRLTAHFGLAIAIYAVTLWTALDLLRPAEANGAAARRGLGPAALGFSALVFVTMLSGGFVAGLNAGFTYNTFPLMDGRLVPAGYLDEQPWWLNLFENVAAVQFNHRLLAVATLLAALALCWMTRADPPAIRSLGNGIAAMALVQVALGIATLLLVVPIPLAAVHQGGAVVVFSLALALAHAARRPALMPRHGAARSPTPQTS